MQQQNEQHALATYVSDMLALERHIRIPFDTQLHDDDFATVTDAAQLVRRLTAVSDDHIKRLAELLDRLGGHEISGIKSAVSGVAGFVAGAIDKSRKTKVSKALRDDYTALALCAASYTELLTTANAMGENAVASTAEELLKDYAGLILDVGRALPPVVAQELAEMGLTLDPSTASSSARQVERAWQMVTVGSTDSAFADSKL